MKVLIDANVLLTYVTLREDTFSNEAAQIIDMCATGKIQGFIAFHTLSILWYVLRKVPDEIRRDTIKQICEILDVAYTDKQAVLEAIGNVGFKDFEDNLQDCCAKSVGADYIVTANVNDFAGHSKVPAVAPDEFIKIVNSK